MLGRLFPLLIFLLLAALLMAGIRLSATRDVSAIPSPLIGKPAPDFVLPALDDPGRTISRSTLQGHPYLLNVWGSWCPACREEHPVVSDLARSGRIRVVGYNYKDTRDQALRWLQQLGNPYEEVIVDADGRAAIDWGIYGAPETFLVDAQGIVRFKYIGPLTPDIVKREILARVEAERGPP